MQNPHCRRETINGGAGDDTLAGGTENYAFQYDTGWNYDTILDWANGSNVTDLVSLSTNFAALTIEDFNVGAEARIFIIAEGPATDTIVISNVNHITIDATDFIFV